MKWGEDEAKLCTKMFAFSCSPTNNPNGPIVPRSSRHFLAPQPTTKNYPRKQPLSTLITAAPNDDNALVPAPVASVSLLAQSFRLRLRQRVAAHGGTPLRTLRR